MTRQEGVIETYETISRMLADLGPRLDVVEIAAFDEQQSWAIALDDETGDAFALDYDAQTAKLYLTADLGAPPQERLATTYDFLLQYNAFWAATGGMRLALDGPGGNVLQIYDRSLHDLNAQQLGDVIENFIVRMRIMRGLLAQGIAEDGGPQDPQKLALGDGTIRA